MRDFVYDLVRYLENPRQNDQKISRKYLLLDSRLSRE